MLLMYDFLNFIYLFVLKIWPQIQFEAIQSELYVRALNTKYENNGLI